MDCQRFSFNIECALPRVWSFFYNFLEAVQPTSYSDFVKITGTVFMVSNYDLILKATHSPFFKQLFQEKLVKTT